MNLSGIAITENLATRRAYDAIHSQREPSDTALQIGRQAVLADLERFADWLACEEGSAPSDYFGDISTAQLFSLVIFNPGATNDQRKAACDLLAERYLSDNEHEVQRLALRAMEV